MNFKEPSLLYHEIPLFHGAIKENRPEKIYVDEGQYHIEDIDNANFAESGGGYSFKLAGLNRVVCWRSYSNTLELFEFSPDIDLHSNHFMIVFEDSKVLPSVNISLEDDHLRIVCCTIRTVHSIVLDVGNARRQQDVKPGQTYPSLLMNMTANDFADANSNYDYGTQIQGLANSFSAVCIKSRSGYGFTTLVGLTMSTSNIALVKITEKGPPSHCIINHTSRISRLWSGLNPWAGTGGTDFASDIKLVVLEDRVFIAAVFKDCKFRMWCAETQELSAMHDLNEHIPHINNEQGPFDFKIRARSDANAISIYVGMVDQANFLQLKVEPNHHGNGLITKFNSCLTLPLTSPNLPQKHLVDYTLTSDNCLVVLWHDAEDVDSVSIAKTNVGVWHDVAMYPPPAGEVPLQPYQDIREAYLDHLFGPGRFCMAAIARALTMHRRSGTGLPGHLTEADLQERVSAHIMQEIQNEIPEEGSDDIVDEVQEKVWNTFFQTCLQYQQVLSRSLGLTTDVSDKHSMISIVHKGFVSVLSPVSSLEAVCRGSNPTILQGILQSETITEQNLEDLSKLIECLGNLHDLLAFDLLNPIHTNICLGGNSPQEVVEDVLPDILDVMREFEGKSPNHLLADVDDVSTAIKMLLVCLEPSDFGHDFDVPDIRRWPLGMTGVELLARNVQLHIKNRFQLVTLLYILTSVLDTIRRPTSLTIRDDEIQLSSRVTSYVQCYQALFWLSTAKTQISSSATLEETLLSLSVHDRSGVKHGVKNVNTLGNSTHSNLLEFFLATLGGRHVKSFLKVQKNAGAENAGTLENLLESFSSDAFSCGLVPAATNYIMTLMWPMGPTLIIPDFLLSHGQHATLKRYLQRNLGSWCTWCPMSRAYLLGHCHLKYADYNKAVRSFILAASGISSEEYMMNKLLREDEDNLHPVTQVIIYYTRVLQMFEKMDLPEQVILLAQHALEEAKRHDSDRNTPILWSSIFRQNNYLLRHSEAFRAILLNPDPDHKKDCLRTLVVSLCERSEYKTLVEFHYGELEDDLVSILEQRARSTDLSQAVHNYYDLLYAFHVHKKNFRRAAAIMYEQSYRLQCELSSVGSSAVAPTNENLQRQLACLVTCLNCLHLVKQDNRWILHPISSQMTSRERLGNKSPKRHYNGEETAKSKARSVVIKELPDIQKEAMLIEKRMKVEEISGKSVPGGNLVTSSEIVSFLCHAGLYDDAILISSKFKLSLVPVFESLATKCVHLTFADDRQTAEAWEWLLQNETAKNNCTRGNKQSTIADEAYRLLQVYIDKHGGDKMRGSTYFHATAKSLLGLSASLPAWFVSLYREKNSPELLRLLVCFDRLEEATSLAIELIDRAKVHVGTELYSDMKCGATWLPYTICEQLLCILKEVDTDPNYEEMYCALTDSLDDYLCLAETASQDIIRASATN